MQKSESMLFKPDFNSQGLLRFLWVFAIFIGIGGCAQDHGITIQDQAVVNEGLYEVRILDNPWLRIPNFGGHTVYALSVRDDIVYLRCPEQQVIAISRTSGQRHAKKGRTQFALFPERARYLVEDLNEDAGMIIQEPVVSRTVELNNNEAIEFEYVVSNPLRLCSRVGKSTEKIKVKMIITRFWRPFGNGGWLVFSYKSPPEMFDQSVAEFDKMVQSFRFTE